MIRKILNRGLPFNAMPDGTARTVKSQYYKNGFRNYFLTNCYGATGVLEIADKHHRGRMPQDDILKDGEAELGELPWEAGARGMGLSDDKHNGDL